MVGNFLYFGVFSSKADPQTSTALCPSTEASKIPFVESKKVRQFLIPMIQFSLCTYGEGASRPMPEMSATRYIFAVCLHIAISNSVYQIL